MTQRYTETKLVCLSTGQKQKIEELQQQITEAGGDASMSAIIRDSIDLAINHYHDEIREKYTPIKVNKDGNS